MIVEIEIPDGLNDSEIRAYQEGLSRICHRATRLATKNELMTAAIKKLDLDREPVEKTELLREYFRSLVPVRRLDDQLP